MSWTCTCARARENAAAAPSLGASIVARDPSAALLAAAQRLETCATGARAPGGEGNGEARGGRGEEKL